MKERSGTRRRLEAARSIFAQEIQAYPKVVHVKKVAEFCTRPRKSAKNHLYFH